MFTLVRMYVRVELSKNVSPYHDVIFLKVNTNIFRNNSQFIVRYKNESKNLC